MNMPETFEWAQTARHHERRANALSLGACALLVIDAGAYVVASTVGAAEGAVLPAMVGLVIVAAVFSEANRHRVIAKTWREAIARAVWLRDLAYVRADRAEREHERLIRRVASEVRDPDVRRRIFNPRYVDRKGATDGTDGSDGAG